MKSALTVVAVVLVVILALLVAAFFLLQGRIYYTDDGQAHVDLPAIFQSARETPEPPAESAPALVVVTPEPTPEPTPTPEPSLQAVLLPSAALTDGTAADQVAAAKGTAAVFDMKSDEGLLGYVSENGWAVNSGASWKRAGLNEAIAALNETGLYTIARVACFRDNLAPRMNNRLSIRSSVGNWRDYDVIRWLSPSVAESRAYLADVCRELAALGFDEIWLDYAGYPAEGNLDFITVGDRYDPEDLTGPVETFYGEVREALADYPQVKLGISCAPGALLEEAGDKSGQTPAVLGEYADRLWLPAPEDAETARSCERAAEALGLSPGAVVYTGEGEETQGGAGRLVTPEEKG